MGSRGRWKSTPQNLQRTRVILDSEEVDLTATEDMGAAVVADPALEGLHINEAREALVRGAAHPLAVSLHQLSQFLYSFRSGGAGCPLLRPQPPHASACRGERPYWWGQGQGLNSARKRGPLAGQTSDVGRTEDRKSVLAEVPDTIAMA